MGRARRYVTGPSSSLAIMLNTTAQQKVEPFRSTAQSLSLAEQMKAAAPQIASRADRCEAERQVPAENVAILREIGFCSAFIPKCYGGGEAEPAEVYRAGRVLAAACPSTGWAMQLLTSHSHLVASFDRRAQDEVWGATPGALVCSAVAPTGLFQRTQDGVRVSGRFRFSSGCDHADWTAVGGMLANETTGNVEPHLALVPKRDYRIDDTWMTMGLKGTGSKDLLIEDVLVPEHRLEALSALASGTSRGVGSQGGALYKIPFMAMFGASFAVAAIGMADGMLRAYTERLSRRSNALTGAKMSQGAPAYMRLAQSTQEVNAAGLVLEADWEDYAAHGRGDKSLGPDTIVFWRANQAFAIKMLVGAVDRLFEASGGGAGFSDQLAQRYWRDIHMAGGHLFADYDAASQVLGRHLLGLPPDPSIM